MDPLVITACLVGAEVTREQTPYLPITAEEIGAEAQACREAGASMVHLHVREPDGKPSQATELFAAAIREVRRRSDIIVQVSTGGAVGMSVEERCGPLRVPAELRPDMATLTTGTVNFGDDVFENPRPLIRDIARRIRACGAVPEIECFDAGMIDEALALAREGLLDLPAHFDFVLGVPGALAATPEALRFMASKLPAGCSWTVAAMSRHELPFAELAIEAGGHARVGLEDNIYLSKGVLAKGSHELVAAVAESARRHGRPIATPAEARRLLRLPARA
ncbi:MAG TPA: 3-keto-5-aminohexanoate cleavage protein [Myxococcales bacterium]|nr:3-keto-5-aminohexanoate cleavage protein [Myxococcales bacterium]